MKFSISVYYLKFVFKKNPWKFCQSLDDQSDMVDMAAQNLFPAICKSEIFPLTNSIRGKARVCAADDLELSLQGEGQIEILDDFAQGNFQNPYHGEFNLYAGREMLMPGVLPIQDGHNQAHQNCYAAEDSLSFGTVPSVYEDRSNFYDTHRAVQMMTSHLPRDPTREYISKQFVPFVQIHSDALPKRTHSQELISPEHQSHFYMNALGVPSNPFFTDFKRPSFTESSSFSSVESFDSPLDEMFVKNSSQFQVSAFLDPLQSSLHSSLHSSIQSSMQNSVQSSGQSSLQNSIQNSIQNSLQNTLQNTLFPSFSDQKKRRYEEYESLASEVSPHTTLDNLKRYKPTETKENPETKKEDSEFRPYKCDECDAVFKVRAYLTRHLRKHNDSKAFVCPFYRESDADISPGKPGAKCHSTGGFSRKDTYKTHLKALHFIYPPRTKSTQRRLLGGRCAGCFEYFESNSDWFKLHIDTRACSGFARSVDVKLEEEESTKVESP